MKLVYVGFKFPHMGKYSGYDVLSRALPYHEKMDCQTSILFSLGWHQGSGLISKLGARVFGQKLWWIDLYVFLKSLISRASVFHHIYAENTFGFFGMRIGARHGVVCTVHQPREFFEKNRQAMRTLSRANGIILLGDQDAEYFRSILGSRRVHVIPHGIDTEFFSPGPSSTRISRQVLMVGNWLRDFDFASKVFQVVLDRDEGAIVVVVASRSNLSLLPDHPRLHKLTNISDADLRDLYRSSSLLFLALSGYVANNAVLEAASCGCQVLISSPQEPSKDSSPIRLVEFDVERAAKAVLSSLGGGGTAPDQIRQWILEHYAWEMIANRTRNVLERSVVGQP